MKRKVADCDQTRSRVHGCCLAMSVTRVGSGITTWCDTIIPSSDTNKKHRGLGCAHHALEIGRRAQVGREMRQTLVHGVVDRRLEARIAVRGVAIVENGSDTCRNYFARSLGIWGLSRVVTTCSTCNACCQVLCKLCSTD